MCLMDHFNVHVNTTKELAKIVGCFETVHVKDVKDSCKHSTHLEDGISKQFDYLIIIDFESTCWEERSVKWKQPEIIEFPAVLLNINTGIIEDEFQQYVMPTENSTLSDFCIRLTGITQNQVEGGVPVGTCLLLFTNWIKKITEDKNLTFHKKVPEKKSCTFVTWSDWDLAVCLHNECKRKLLKKPDILCQWIDLRTIYRKFFHRQPKGLRGALSEMGLQFKGREHSGLCDARNTADLAYHMVQNGAVLAITRVLQPGSTNILRKAFAVLKQTANNGSTLSAKTTPLNRNVQESVRKPLHDIDTPLSTRSTSFSNKFNCNVILDSSVDLINPQHTRPLRNHLSITKSFANHQICNITVKKSNNHCHNGKKNETPDSVRPPRLSSCKRTPPLCKCGRRALRRFASLPGPNQGRMFYSCSKGRSLGLVQNSSCGFFKWET